MQNLEPAPLFRPTLEQFEDPLKYISLIRPQAEQYGLCRIQPPEAWQPPFMLDRRTFRLRPRVQEVHSLQHRLDTSSEDAQFWGLYGAWLAHQGRSTRGRPLFQGREVDLPRLYRAVCKRGGFAQLGSAGWAEVARILQVGARAGLRLLAPVLSAPCAARAASSTWPWPPVLQLSALLRCCAPRRGRLAAGA